MSWVVKALSLVLGGLVGVAVQAKDVYVLALGQSLASNCNEHVYGPLRGVYQMGPDGTERPAADPLDGADCRLGSMWMPMARQMVAAGLADRVVLVPVGVASARARDWMPGGSAHVRLDASLAAARQNGVAFDFVLWHQGEDDGATAREAYRSAVARVMRDVAVAVPVRHWLVARQSGCAGQAHSEVAQAQKELSTHPVLRRFAGPDTDALGLAFRWKGCLLNHAGQEEMARQWVESMRQAMDSGDRVDKESLLHYFRWDLASVFKSVHRGRGALSERAQVAAAH